MNLDNASGKQIFSNTLSFLPLSFPWCDVFSIDVRSRMGLWHWADQLLSCSWRDEQRGLLNLHGFASTQRLRKGEWWSEGDMQTMIGGYTGFMHGFLRFIICSFCISTAAVDKSIVDRLHSFIGGILPCRPQWYENAMLSLHGPV